MSNDSTAKTLIVATILCVVCSVVVSWSAVSLRPLQEENKALDIKKNLLMTAGIVESTAQKKEIEEAYKQIEAKLVDLKTGEYVTDIKPSEYDANKAAKDPKRNYKIPSEEDLGNIKVRAKYGKVYFVKDGEETKSVVFPIHGKGLWSTMYGFLVLETDLNTVKGIGFYAHGETPGLGGEIDNPQWRAVWPGKKIFGENGNPQIQVIKGEARDASKFDIDGLSGATLTANGVTGTVRYWMGDDAYGPFIDKYTQGGGE
ncbi:Na(+)-translocating NADH-quinone reductase subunit C [Halobacteriovorax sp.]|uniref:Na(+)-translocating NADH-quinone reductase subunit C n=1 Tax=Halobacteriovorax sp. TaxID=2020862 RepID=UPI003AF1F9D1